MEDSHIGEEKVSLHPKAHWRKSKGWKANLILKRDLLNIQVPEFNSPPKGSTSWFLLYMKYDIEHPHYVTVSWSWISPWERVLSSQPMLTHVNMQVSDATFLGWKGRHTEHDIHKLFVV